MQSCRAPSASLLHGAAFRDFARSPGGSHPEEPRPQRLRQELDGSRFHRLNRHRYIPVACNEDDRHVGAIVGDALLQLETAQSRHRNVEHQTTRNRRPGPGTPKTRRRKRKAPDASLRSESAVQEIRELKHRRRQRRLPTVRRTYLVKPLWSLCSIHGKPTSRPRSKPRGVQEPSDPSRGGSRSSQPAGRARGR